MVVESSTKWEPSISDIIAIGAIAMAVILWLVQPGWRIGVPLAILVVGLFIFAAIRHRGNLLFRVGAATVATGIFLAVSLVLQSLPGQLFVKLDEGELGLLGCDLGARHRMPLAVRPSRGIPPFPEYDSESRLIAARTWSCCRS